LSSIQPTSKRTRKEVIGQGDEITPDSGTKYLARPGKVCVSADYLDTQSTKEGFGRLLHGLGPRRRKHARCCLPREFLLNPTLDSAAINQAVTEDVSVD